MAASTRRSSATLRTSKRPVMRVRIIRPLPAQLEDLDVSRLRFGASYDLQSPLSDLLLASGYAVPEDDAQQPSLKPKPAKAATRNPKRAAK